MTSRPIFRSIVAPLAFQNMLAGVGNETTAVIKASAITSVITMRDLLGGPSVVGKVYLDPFSPRVAAAVGYVLLVQIVGFAVARPAASLSVDEKPIEPPLTMLSEIQA